MTATHTAAPVAWNLADLWEAAADRFPDSPAVATPGSAVAWRDFDARADGVARALLDAGLDHQAKIAQYLHNCPEYLESFFACCKASLVPVAAVVEAAPGVMIDTDQLVDTLRGSLAGFKVPRLDRFADLAVGCHNGLDRCERPGDTLR